jgi:hypothetical protein
VARWLEAPRVLLLREAVEINGKGGEESSTMTSALWTESSILQTTTRRLAIIVGGIIWLRLLEGTRATGQYNSDHVL